MDGVQYAMTTGNYEKVHLLTIVSTDVTESVILLMSNHCVWHMLLDTWLGLYAGKSNDCIHVYMYVYRMLCVCVQGEL